MKGNPEGRRTLAIFRADGEKGAMAVAFNLQALRTVFEVVIRERLELFFEKEVTSFADLVKAVRVLDQDSGIRLIGERNGRECLVFVTRFGESFTMMTYTMVSRTGAPGRRLGVLEFDGADAVAAALRRAAPGRIRAYVY